MRVLLCDDDQSQVFALEKHLGSFGITDVQKAYDGQNGKEKLKTGHFDLVILDLHMPHYSGDHLLDYMRVVQRSHTPVVIVTSDTDELVQRRVIENGADYFLPKPVEKRDIGQMLRNVHRFARQSGKVRI